VHLLRLLALAASCAALLPASHAAPSPATSRLLTKKNDGTWSFPTVEVGGRAWSVDVFDFSYAGYRYGEREEFTDIPSETRTISARPDEDITDKLNAALASLPRGGTVRIPAGTYRIGAGKIGDAVVVTTDNTVIRGAGAGKTRLVVDPTYRSAEKPRERQSAAFSTGVIAFGKPASGGWFYGPLDTAVVAKPVALGSREVVLDDASAFSTGDTIVLRQFMWEAFVAKNANNPSKAPRALRWTNYTDDHRPRFSSAGDSFAFLRRVLAKRGDTLLLDVPLPRDLDPADMPIRVARVSAPLLRNCGLADLSLAAPDEEGAAKESSVGTTLQIRGLVDGLFKNVAIESFRTLGFATSYAVNVSFLDCSAANAINCGGGGSGYGFYIKGQNLLYKNCSVDSVRHGFTTAAPQTCNIIIRGCSSENLRFNSDIPSGEAVDDTHLKYAYALLWDGHRSRDAGLLMINRGTLSGDAYETCGWAIVWNYRSAGINTKSFAGNDMRRNLLALTPAEFGIVVGAHAAGGPAGIRVQDGYTRWPSTSWGERVTTSSLHVGPVSGRVLYEHTGRPVAGSIYDIQFARRAKLLR
jgi:hypothetical protein